MAIHIRDEGEGTPSPSIGRQGKYDDPGFFPDRVATEPRQWPMYEGHLDASCSFGQIREKITVLPCPECLRLTMAAFPERYRPLPT